MSKKKTNAALTNVSGSATSPAGTAGTMLSRHEAATRLGVSDTTYRRIERTLQPFVDANGVHRIAAEQIEQLRIRRGRAKTADTPGSYTGELSAEVLQLLDDGTTPREIMKRLAVHPVTLKAILVDVHNLQGAFLVDGDQALKLEWYFGTQAGGFPISSFEVLEGHIRELHNPQCGRCKKKPPRICLTCARLFTAEQAAAAEQAALVAAQQQTNERIARGDRQEAMLRPVLPPRGRTPTGPRQNLTAEPEGSAERNVTARSSDSTAKVPRKP